MVHHLELQDGAYLGEGWRWPHHRYESDLLLKLFSKANKKSVDEVAVLHVVAKLAEFISNCLDPLTEKGHRCVSLGDGAELGM